MSSQACIKVLCIFYLSEENIFEVGKIFKEKRWHQFKIFMSNCF